MSARGRRGRFTARGLVTVASADTSWTSLSWALPEQPARAEVPWGEAANTVRSAHPPVPSSPEETRDPISGWSVLENDQASRVTLDQTRTLGTRTRLLLTLPLPPRMSVPLKKRRHVGAPALGAGDQPGVARQRVRVSILVTTMQPQGSRRAISASQ